VSDAVELAACIVDDAGSLASTGSDSLWILLLAAGAIFVGSGIELHAYDWKVSAARNGGAL
jgi:hypothetical protein